MASEKVQVRRRTRKSTAAQVQHEDSMLAHLAATVAVEAGRLERPLRWCGLVTLGASLVFWLICFSSYLVESVNSFVVCALVLVVALLPGLLLMRLRGMLHELSTFDSGHADEDRRATVPQAGESAESNRLVRFRNKIDRTLQLWTHVSEFRDGLLELGAPRRPVIYLSRPASTVTIALTLLAAALIALAAVFSVVFGGLSFIF